MLLRCQKYSQASSPRKQKQDDTKKRKYFSPLLPSGKRHLLGQCNLYRLLTIHHAIIANSMPNDSNTSPFNFNDRFLLHSNIKLTFRFPPQICHSLFARPLITLRNSSSSNSLFSAERCMWLLALIAATAAAISGNLSAAEEDNDISVLRRSFGSGVR